MGTTRKDYYLELLGIQQWKLRESSTMPATKPDKTALWQQLKQRVATCTACSLHQYRTQTVFGVGNEQADILIVGEAPGEQEDRKGEPFVGRAGQLLDSMLRSIGVHRKQIYIANVLKSRPPRNRDPLPEEIKQCTPFLREQIELLEPKLIIAMGRFAAHYLLETTTPLSALRHSMQQYQERIPVIVTYHPAYLLRSPQQKRQSYIDLLKIKEWIEKLNVYLPPVP